ncbi:hypothetical protein ONZ45_g13334 [Pleurotus djamor]|nr:hypothetical protein ONZ45_g13334 [Pleurotus djamor]
MSGFDRRRVTDKTDREVEATAEVMRSQPHCISVLYGTHCTQAHLVPIPYVKHYAPQNERNKLPPPMTIDNLFVECWMPRGMKQKGEDRITIRVPSVSANEDDHVSSSTDEEELEEGEAYTIFYASQSQKRDSFSSPPEKRNAAVANIFYNREEEQRGRRMKEVIWYGPILVVKHSMEEMAPLDIHADELGRVWELVEATLRKGIPPP